MRRTLGAVTLAGVALALSACSASSTPAPAPSPSAVPLRTIAPCPATTVVPDDAVGATPDPSAPPTVSVSVGDAFRFPVPRGARVGLTGDPDPADDAGLCTAASSDPTTATVVALAAGYSRIAVQVGIQTPAGVLVRVTP